MASTANEQDGGAAGPSRAPAPTAASTTARETLFAFAHTLAATRADVDIGWESQASASASASRAGPRHCPSAGTSTGNPIWGIAATTSNLRSPAASRRMVAFLGALPPLAYHDVQMLVERGYRAYRAEYRRVWGGLFGGGGDGADGDEDRGARQQDEEEEQDEDGLLLEGFLATVLSWNTLADLRRGDLFDEDEDEEARRRGQQRDGRGDTEDQAEAGQDERGQSYAAQQREIEGRLTTGASNTTTKKEGAAAVLYARAQAFQRLLDLVVQYGVQDGEEGIEQLHAVVNMLGSPFLLSLDASTRLRRQAYHLHILAKRTFFLLESAYRLRLMVEFAHTPTPVRAPAASRLAASMRLYKLRELVSAGAEEGDEVEDDDEYAGLLTGNGRTSNSMPTRASQRRGQQEQTDYPLDVLSFYKAVRKRISAPDVLAAIERDVPLSALGGHREGWLAPPHGGEGAHQPPGLIAQRLAARLDGIAPVEADENARFWAMMQVVYPHLGAEGVIAGGHDAVPAARNANDAGPNEAPPLPPPMMDMRDIFRRRPREPISLRRLLHTLVPERVREGLYVAAVPAPIRILIASPEARAMVPQLLMHTGWLLFKVLIFMSVLTARLGVPVPTGQQQQPRARRTVVHAAGHGGAAAAAAAGQGQGQGRPPQAGPTRTLLAQLSTLGGWWDLADSATSLAGLPPFSLYWQFYALCACIGVFVFWDMERWLRRRLEQQRREARRALRAQGGAGAGRAPPPPAREGAAQGGGDGDGVEGGVLAPPTPTTTTTTPAGIEAAQGSNAPPPSAPPPVYAPRRGTPLVRHPHHPRPHRAQRGGAAGAPRRGWRDADIVLAASLGPGPLLRYLLERLSYVGLGYEDEELGLIPRARAPVGAVIDDATGLVRGVEGQGQGHGHGQDGGGGTGSSTGAAMTVQRLHAPAWQIRVLYADIDNEHPSALHGAGRWPLSHLAHALRTRHPNLHGAHLALKLVLEVLHRTVLAFALLVISVVPECEMLRRRAVERRMEVWRGARRREGERRARVVEYEAEVRARAARDRAEREKEKEGTTTALGPAGGDGEDDEMGSLRRRRLPFPSS